MESNCLNGTNGASFISFHQLLTKSNPLFTLWPKWLEYALIIKKVLLHGKMCFPKSRISLDSKQYSVCLPHSLPLKKTCTQATLQIRSSLHQPKVCSRGVLISASKMLSLTLLSAIKQ